MIAKAVAAPHVAMTTPASSGPSARAALNWALLSVTACSSRSRGTSSVTNDCQIGVLSPPASPDTNASAAIHAVVAEPDATIAYSARAHAACAIWQTTSSARRGNRSASVPPTRPISMNGTYWKKPVTPTSPARPVRSNTTYGMAAFCIQLPVFETTAPIQNKRKSR